jgi:tetratricopeptide (TPR) repeat protein
MAFVFLQIVVALLLLSLTGMLISWLASKEGTVILPFENATGEEKFNGRAISDSLVVELLRIRQIHSERRPGIRAEIRSEKLNLPALAPSNENIAGSLADVGTVGLGDTTVSVGKLLLTLKQLWPFGDRGNVIAGSLQKYGAVYRLVARMEHHDVRAWEVSRELKGDSELPDLIRELAYRLTKDLSPEIAAKSWLGFRYYTDALDAYTQFTQCERDEDFQQAQTNCLEAARIEPKYKIVGDLLYNLAYTSIDHNNYSVAEEMLRQAIQLDPKSAYPHNGLGNVCYDLYRTNEAIAEYQQAIALDLKFAHPHHGLGNVYSDLGRTDEAIAEYRQAIALDPKSAHPHNSLGRVYADLKLSDKAIAEYQQAIALNPKFASPHNGLGVMYQFAGQLEQASAEFKRAVGLEPNNDSFQISLVGILNKLGHKVEAAEHLKIARELIAKKNEYNRARFASACGDVDEALVLLKIALEKKQTSLDWARRDPDFESLRSDPRFIALVGEE